MEEIIKKRILVVFAVFTAIVISFAYLNIQIDDERYYGFYEYEGYPENANLDSGVVTVDENTGVTEGSIIAEIPAIHVDAGTYILDVDHQNDNDFEAIVYDGETEVDRLVLPSSEINTKISFTLHDNLYNMRIVYIYNGEGTVTLKRTILYADGLFYTDTLFFAVLIILAAAIIVFIIIKKNILLLSAKEMAFWAILLVFAIGISYPYYRPMWHMPPDGAFHLARIEGIYNELRRGQFPVVMFNDALHGRGTIAALYPQLFLYIPALFRMMGVSLDGAVRVFFIIINIATCGTAYYAAKRLTGNPYFSLFTMMIYCLLPYRLLVLLERSAFGEAQAFVFIPLVIAGLYDVIIADKGRWPVLAIGMSGVLQSHVISTMNVIIVCVAIGCIYTAHIVKENRFIQIMYSIVTTMLLNLWYIIPFIMYMRSDIGINEQMMTQDFSDEAYYVSRLIQLFPKQGLHIYSMGLGLILLTILGVYLQLTAGKRNSKERFALVLTLIGLAFLLMELKAFPWLTLQKIQRLNYITKMVKFPARLSVIIQPMLLYGAISMLAINRFRIPRIKLMLILAVSLTLFQGYIITDSFLENLEEFITPNEMRFEADVADQFSYDYVPSGYWEDDFPITPESPVAEISGYEHRHGHSGFVYKSDEDSYVDMPILYYLGYRAVSSEGENLLISKGDNAAMRISLPAADEEVHVSIDFDSGYGWLWNTLFTSAFMVFIILSFYLYKVSRTDA